MPSKSEIFDVVKAQAESLDALSKNFVNLETKFEKQDDKNFGIIIAVLVASVLIVMSVAVQILVSDKRDTQRFDQLMQRVYELQEKQAIYEVKANESLKQLDIIRSKNPYLK